MFELGMKSKIVIELSGSILFIEQNTLDLNLLNEIQNSFRCCCCCHFSNEDCITVKWFYIVVFGCSYTQTHCKVRAIKSQENEEKTTATTMR